jgi:cell division protein FtsB
MRKKKIKSKIISAFGRIMIAVATVYVVYILIQQQMQLNTYKAQQDYYKAQIELEQKKLQELENNKLLYTTDSYIEKIAREKLGLVKPEEVIFVDINK